MLSLTGKSVLLFCPRFFCYEQEIKKTLEQMGCQVVWYDDRPANDFMSKALIRLDKNVLSRKIKGYYNKVLDEVSSRDFDYIFFVNPEAISNSIMNEFKVKFSTAKFLLYMWDSFRNRKQNLELLPFFDKMFTFDPQDAKKYNLIHRPLFYIDTYSNSLNGNLNQAYDLLFIGTAHSDRYLFVKELISGLNRKIKLYFFLSSKLLFFSKLLFDRDFKRVKFRDISFKSLSHSDISKLMANSKVILDINHPEQIGLTMRTFETMGANRKLITTNEDVLSYDFYDPANILLVNRNKPIIDEDFFQTSFVTPSKDLLFKYNIKGWATEIFSES